MFHISQDHRQPSYYDTIEEMPIYAAVYYPGETNARYMTVDEILKMENEGWYTIMHSVNWGVCDHWTSEKLSTWVKERFSNIIAYTDSTGKVIGYNRREWDLRLTRESNFRESEVWNS